MAAPSSKCGAALKRSCLSSAGSTSAATHSSLAYLVTPRQRTDGGAGCAQPDDSDLSLSPGLSGSITMVMPMSSSPVLSVLQSGVPLSVRVQIPADLKCCPLSPLICRADVYDCMMNNIQLYNVTLLSISVHLYQSVCVFCNT